jgi:hypothetical protein
MIFKKHIPISTGEWLALQGRTIHASLSMDGRNRIESLSKKPANSGPYLSIWLFQMDRYLLRQP